ncbi:MAG: CPBP family intramembrane metalloprotease [Thermoanaerobacteraceae bacterium]|nr:CPBP family intramembrane metalloprotease [Thermoanaerobacteraceae bacterium]
MKQKVPWNILDSLLALAVISGISLGAGSVVLPLLNTLIGVSPENIRVQFFAGSIVQTALIFLVICYYVLVKYNGSFKHVGYVPKPLADTLWTALKWGVGIFLAVFLSGIVVERLVPGPQEMQPFAKLVLEADSTSELILPFVIAVIIAPLGEETFFRGFLYPAFRQRVGIAGGLAATGLIFGIMHFDLVRLLPLSIGGAGLAWLYEKTGTIYAPVMAHGIWNGIMLLLLVATANAM